MTAPRDAADDELKLTPAQWRALDMLPVEVGAYGAPPKPTLRVLIRLGLAREVHYGGGGIIGPLTDCPPDVVITDAGREARAKHRARAGAELAERLSEDQRRALLRVYTEAPLDDRDLFAIRSMRGIVNGPRKALITPVGEAAAKHLSGLHPISVLMGMQDREAAEVSP